MPKAQDEIDIMRISLAEIDANNSRWDDTPHLLKYLNEGRRAWAKESEAIKAIFKQTTVIGATLGSAYARYQLDPTVWDIDSITWDDGPVNPIGDDEFEQFIIHRKPAQQGTPYIYRRMGDSIDLYYAPDSAKVLAVRASVFTTDLPLLTSDELELTVDQAQGAIDYAVAMALLDDDRDASVYLQKFNASASAYKKKVSRKGPRMVKSTISSWPI